ncbi:MAG TPA: hypothetical protein VJ011_00260 [Steroidobacteraceae bacterium]|nr:hypothetical protein [Steroidobacteraceae bacterium]
MTRVASDITRTSAQARDARRLLYPAEDLRHGLPPGACRFEKRLVLAASEIAVQDAGHTGLRQTGCHGGEHAKARIAQAARGRSVG